MTMPNLFDDETKQCLINLFTGPKPTREAYLAQLKSWQDEAEAHHKAAQLAQIAADQDRRVKRMKDR